MYVYIYNIYFILVMMIFINVLKIRCIMEQIIFTCTRTRTHVHILIYYCHANLYLSVDQECGVCIHKCNFNVLCKQLDSFVDVILPGNHIRLVGKSQTGKSSLYSLT